MKYIEVNFNITPTSETANDVLAAQLAEIGFESFVEQQEGISAYVPIDEFSVDKINSLIEDFILDVNITFSFKEMEDKNWNEEWENNFFKPIVFEDKCVVHSSFHKPEGEFEYDILIDPKMAFGTGHHQTTGLILKEMLNMDFKNKTVLDMGCGTAVLAILASMMGSGDVVAIDIDEWAYNNAVENVALNNINNVRVELGGAELLGNQSFDIIIANINRNILLRDIPHYANVLNPEGILMLSGFYEEDIPALRVVCTNHKIELKKSANQDKWAAMICQK
mgnify:CR=1 FL=1